MNDKITLSRELVEAALADLMDYTPHALLAPLRAALSEPVQPEPLIEAWHKDRKVTIYADKLLRVWGPNIDTEMSEHPRTLAEVDDAMRWLYADSPRDSVQPVYGTWQSMESAPRDGTKVFLDWGVSGVCIGWHEERSSKKHLSPWRRDLFGLHDTMPGYEPLRWMPLPPVDQPAEGEKL